MARKSKAATRAAMSKKELRSRLRKIRWPHALSKAPSPEEQACMVTENPLLFLCARFALHYAPDEPGHPRPHSVWHKDSFSDLVGGLLRLGYSFSHSKTPTGQGALGIVAEGHPDLVEVLLDHGADVHALLAPSGYFATSGRPAEGLCAFVVFRMLGFQAHLEEAGRVEAFMALFDRAGQDWEMPTRESGLTLVEHLRDNVNEASPAQLRMLSMIEERVARVHRTALDDHLPEASPTLSTASRQGRL